MVALHDEGTPGFTNTYDSFVEKHSGINTPLVELTAYEEFYSKPDFDKFDLRANEYELTTVDGRDEFAAIFDT